MDATESIQHIRGKVDEIFNIVVGNEHDEDSGIIKKLQQTNNRIDLVKSDFNKRITPLETDNIRAKAYIAAFIAVGFAFGFIIQELIGWYRHP